MILDCSKGLCSAASLAVSVGMSGSDARIQHCKESEAVS